MPYVFDFDHSHRRPPMEMKDLLGGKGANLAEMTSVLRLPVPPGFTISTDACRAHMEGGWPEGLDAEVARARGRLERAMGKAIGESPAALLAGSGQIDRFFSLKDAAPADGLEWLDATPRTQGGTFEWVRLGFQGNTLKAMELKDNFGQKTILKFGGLDENPRLKPELFEFTPPKGVDVMREQ